MHLSAIREYISENRVDHARGQPLRRGLRSSVGDFRSNCASIPGALKEIIPRPRSPDNPLRLSMVCSLKSLPFSKLAPYASLTSMRRCILHFPSDEYAPARIPGPSALLIVAVTS